MLERLSLLVLWIHKRGLWPFYDINLPVLRGVSQRQKQPRFNPHITMQGRGSVIVDRCLASYCVSRLVWSVQAVWDKVEAQKGIGEAWGCRWQNRGRVHCGNDPQTRTVRGTLVLTEHVQVPAIPLIALWCFHCGFFCLKRALALLVTGSIINLSEIII